MHIRHFGFLANAVRAKKLLRCRELTKASGVTTPSLDDIVPAFTWDEPADRPGSRCPKCGKGHVVRHVLDPGEDPDPFHAQPGIDSS